MKRYNLFLLNQFLFRHWNCRDYNSMLKLVEQSTELIPNDIITKVLENMILPKIQSEVEQWDPLTDLVPIHLWIHPWLPYLSKLKLLIKLFFNLVNLK